ncbi:putative toxin-antitoxin system toxin component, PIN family [Prosthecobacter sp.]|uniref:putative toxin-antitoxin system toxin component, PIN family n=1 Tax=Prosthecobacter sp. TaxID=1965333 RepID=UPI003783C5F9
MTVVIDTNVIIQMFGSQSPYDRLKQALSNGEIHLVVSAAIYLEYEEVVVRYADAARWTLVERFLQLISMLHDTVVRVNPSFRFRLISRDQDDDAFADAAITAEAAFIITHDRHFNDLHGSGYRPRPITPEDFIARFL